MPAFYAHDRFGKEVITLLRGEIKEVCVKYFNEFALGLQGPDFLFFYKPLSKNKVNQLGHQMHKLHCSSILKKMLEEVRMRGVKSSTYAYVLGFICHFILDSECHPYVADMMEYLQLGHLDIEAEFEKYLLYKDNQKPEEYRLDKLVEEPLDIISLQRLYPSLKVSEMEAAIHDLKKYKKFLCAPHHIKRTLITTGLKISGNYKSLKGVMLSAKLNPKCNHCNEGLWHRYENAKSIAVEMLNDFHHSVVEGKELNARFDRSFE